MIDGGHVANAPLPTLRIPTHRALEFSIRARFDNIISDAVHSAVKLRSAGFDIVCACTGCSDFVCVGEAIIDTDVFVENAKKFGTYCGKNPTMSIVNAAEAVLGK